MAIKTLSAQLGRLPFFEHDPSRPATRSDFRPLQQALPGVMMEPGCYSDFYSGQTGFPNLLFPNSGPGRWLDYTRDDFHFKLSPAFSVWRVVDVEYKGQSIYGGRHEGYDWVTFDRRALLKESSPIWAKMREVIAQTVLDVLTWNQAYVREHGGPPQVERDDSEWWPRT